MRAMLHPFMSIVVALSSLAGLTSCGLVPALPDTFEVHTSATETFTAQKGTGPAVLAGGTWSLVRKADPEGAEPPPSPPPGPYGGILSGEGLERPPVGSRIFLVEFDQDGVMARVTQNRFFLPQFYGSEVPVGAEWRGTTLPGVFYNSAAYGGEQAGRIGLATVVNVRFAGFFVGRAVLYAWGTVADELVDGRFGYLLDFTDGFVAGLGAIADEYPVEGEPVGP